MEALTVYQRYFPNFTPSCFQQDMIESAVTNIDAWDKTLYFWASNDYRPASIGKMLEYYDKLQEQPSDDWVAEAIKMHADSDPRLVEIAVLQVLIMRVWNGNAASIQTVKYFQPAIEELCGKIDKATEMGLTAKTIEVILQRRREQYAKTN